MIYPYKPEFLDQVLNHSEKILWDLSKEESSSNQLCTIHSLAIHIQESMVQAKIVEDLPLSVFEGAIRYLFQKERFYDLFRYSKVLGIHKNPQYRQG